jgi:hypothetical protein
LPLNNSLTPWGSYPGKKVTPWCSKVVHFSLGGSS